MSDTYLVTGKSTPRQMLQALQDGKTLDDSGGHLKRLAHRMSRYIARASKNRYCSKAARKEGQ